MTETAVYYTRAKDIMSITEEPDQEESGVTLDLGLLGYNPRVLLNNSSSKTEGIK